MAVAQPDVITEDDLTDADRKILDVLSGKPLTKGAIVDRTGLHRNTVGNRLDALNYGGAIDCIHDRTALYELVDDPRDDVEPTPDPTDLQARIDALESDLTEAREDVEYYKSELRDCREQLEEVPDRQQIKRAIEDLEHALENGGADVEVAIRRLKDAAGVEHVE